MTLTGWAGVTSRAMNVKGVYHWINCVGVYHRRRRRYGLGFCPLCLAENRCFQRQWRLSFWTVCPIHRVLLSDGCPRCDEPVRAHGHVLDITCCWNCNIGLDRATPVPAQLHASQGLLYSAVLESRTNYEVCGYSCTGPELLWGADAVLSGFRTIRSPDAGQKDGQWARLELRRAWARHEDMRLLDRILWARGDEISFLARGSGVTQKCFRQSCPRWVDDLVSQLPFGRTGRGNRSLDAEIRLARDAQRRRLQGWREMRARVLLKMSGWKNEY